ncbi:MAG TPA: DNA ligase D [Acidobacteriaceae bacterium]|jgi:bifunctional non-homologous end joining protein LigD|nr:DNA ligase D [Acidobacteriaceae bacterium]
MPKTSPQSATKRAASRKAAPQAKPRKSSRSASPSDAVDQQLDRYRAMRDFAMTAEPSGSSAAKPRSGEDLPFVVQKHAATRLHYDFRLGWRGVLKSWAVTKGPSYVVNDKRLAVEVEDHPIEYGGFEGAIPKGQYGGGTVMVWDQGTWEPVTPVDEGLAKGHIKFILHGKKLKGHWALIRMKGDRFGEKGKNNWLLIKEHDEHERSAEAPAITEEAPDSAVTGRSMDQIAAAEDHVWNSNKPEKPPANRSRLTRRDLASKAQLTARALPPEAPRRVAPPDRSSALRDAPKEKMPGFLGPELATSVAEPPEGNDWLHELKLDGYRIQIHVDEHAGKRRARLFTRKGLDWTHRMPAVAAAAAQLPVHAVVLDGEVVVLDEKGRTNFADLQAAFDENAPHPLTYFAFDLLHLDGHNLRPLALERRKAVLEGLLQERGAESDPEQILRYSSHVRARGREMFRKACEMGVEGIVSKLASAPYRAERSRVWLKSKCVLQQEFVVGGFTELSNGSRGIGSLLLGYYKGDKLIYAGRTGTGFTRKTHELLRDRLDPLQQSATPFDHPPAEAKKDAIRVKPTTVVEVRFATWTSDNLVRQAAFLGLREDKKPKDVARETAGPVPKAGRREPSTENDASDESKPAAPRQRGGRSDHHPSPAGSASRVTPRSSAGRKDRAEVAGVSISHPDKVLDEQSGITKLQLAEYYAAVADHVLPHIAHRPLSIVRCPEGSGKPCFFQKHIGMGVPRGIDSVPVVAKGGGAAEQYLTLSSVEGLVGLAQLGVLEIHPWGSRNETLEKPDRLIIDLDPDEQLARERLVESAIEVRGLMKQLGLESFVKSTGGKGLHVVAPVAPEHEWPEFKEFAHNFVLMMERAKPKLYLTKMTKAARTGRIFLDYLRNERGATAVAPWSPRARIGVRVAVPLTWAELERTDPRQFSVATFSDWRSRLKRDPWLKMDAVHQKLTDRAIAAVAGMAAGRSAQTP